MAIVQPKAHTVDALTVIKAPTLIAAANGVPTGSVIVDVGDAPIRADLVVNATAVEVASTDEVYVIILQGSPDAAFGTATNIVELAVLQLGAKVARLSDADIDSGPGVYVVPISNTFPVAGVNVCFRYLRLWGVNVGSIATGINYSAALCNLHAE